MQKIYRSIFLLLLILPLPGVSQIKFLNEGEKALGLDVTYSRVNQTDTYQAQAGYSGGGMYDIGFMYGKASIVNLVGAYFDRSLLKPQPQVPLGMNVGLAVSRSWFTATVFEGYVGRGLPDSYDVSLKTLALTFGIEAYLVLQATDDVSFYPSIHVSRYVAKTTPSGYLQDSPFMNYAYDVDVYLKASSKAIIVTPGFFQTNDKSSFGASLALIKYL
jgi:hypothetical protein